MFRSFIHYLYRSPSEGCKGEGTADIGQKKIASPPKAPTNRDEKNNSRSHSHVRENLQSPMNLRVFGTAGGSRREKTQADTGEDMQT